MSLYDKYFSKINENHMFQLIKNIILEEKGINIETNKYLFKIFKERYPLIFYENDKETLIEFNKILIDDICNRIVNNKINDNKEISKIEPIIEEKVEEKEYCVFQSSKRNTESLNRFNYKVPFNKSKLRINKLIIPYEDNILFITNDLVLKINDENVYLVLTSKGNINSREYLTFEPMNENWMNIKDSELNIKIIDELGREIKEKDIFTIQSMKNISLKNKEYICIILDNDDSLKDIIKGDKIGLMNNNMIIDITTVILKTDKYLVCDLLKNQDNEYNYNELINLSLQNKIYCERS